MFLADGLGTQVNEKGITSYNNLISALLEKGNSLFVFGFLPWFNTYQDIYRYLALHNSVPLGYSFASFMRQWVGG